MPRIRNWKDLNLYKAYDELTYEHIDSLMNKTINWEVIKAHWEDLMQVAISIQKGTVLPSFILHKLGINGRKTKLYKAFRELGRVKRTIYLLHFINDATIGKKITTATTKIESFNSFCDWITFGGKTIMTGDPVEQDKHVKYTTLIANAIMLNNVADITKIIRELRKNGQKITDEMLSHLSPYIRSHIRRFGDFVLNTNKIPEPLNVKNIN